MKNIKILFYCLFLALVCQVANAQQDDKLSIYPNPFHDSCTFEISNLTNDTVTLEVFNRWGGLVKNFHTNDVLNGDYRYTFHGDTLPQDSYYVSYVVNGEQKAQIIMKINPTEVGEFENKAPDLLIYPNPSSEIIYLNLFNKKDEDYGIYNSSGRIVQSGKLKQNCIDISKLPLGSYFITLSNNTVKIVGSFVKE